MNNRINSLWSCANHCTLYMENFAEYWNWICRCRMRNPFMAIEWVFFVRCYLLWQLSYFTKKLLPFHSKWNQHCDKELQSDETIFNLLDCIEYFKKKSFYWVRDKENPNIWFTVRKLQHKFQHTHTDVKFFILHVQNNSFDFRIVKCECNFSMPTGNGNQKKNKQTVE